MSQEEQLGASRAQLGIRVLTIGPQVGGATASGAEQGAQLGVIVTEEMHGRQASNERRPPKSSHEEPVQEAQGAQLAHDVSAAAAHGAQSCAKALAEAKTAAMATRHAFTRIFIVGKLLLNPDIKQSISRFLASLHFEGIETLPYLPHP